MVLKVKKSLALFLSCILLVSCFTGFGITSQAKELKEIQLNINNGLIEVFPSYYKQNGTIHSAQSAETRYIITGEKSNADAIFKVFNYSNDAENAIFNVTFSDLKAYAAEWCSLISVGSSTNGNKNNITINLRLEGENIIKPHSHYALAGSAVFNISAAPNSTTTFEPTYSNTYQAFENDIVLNKVGGYNIKLGDNPTDSLDDGKTGKPLIIYRSTTDPICEAPDTITAVYGQSLSELPLVNPENNTPGTWEWDDASIDVDKPSDTPYYYSATFTPDDTATYCEVTKKVAVTVTKGAVPASEYFIPSGLYAEFGKTLSTVTLPKGWSWDKPNSVLLADGEFSATFNSNPELFNSINAKLSVMVAKLSPSELNKLTTGRKSFKAVWKKAGGVDGYEIQYSLKKNMKKSKKLTVKGAAKTKATVKKLKAKKTYYVRIRTYKTVNGKKVFSSWSAKKTVKTK